MLDEGPIVLDQRSARREIVLGRRGSGGGLLRSLEGSGRVCWGSWGDLEGLVFNPNERFPRLSIVLPGKLLLCLPEILLYIEARACS